MSVIVFMLNYSYALFQRYPLTKIFLFKFTNIQLIYQHFYQQLQCKDIHIVHQNKVKHQHKNWHKKYQKA